MSIHYQIVADACFVIKNGLVKPQNSSEQNITCASNSQSELDALMSEEQTLTYKGINLLDLSSETLPEKFTSLNLVELKDVLHMLVPFVKTLPDNDTKKHVMVILIMTICVIDNEINSVSKMTKIMPTNNDDLIE